MRAIAWLGLVLLPVVVVTSCGLASGGDDSGFGGQGTGAAPSTSNEIGGFPTSSPTEGGTHAGGKGTGGGGAAGGSGGASSSSVAGSSSSAHASSSSQASSSSGGGACHPADSTTVCCPDASCGPGNGQKCCQLQDTFACGNGNCAGGSFEFACDDTRDCGTKVCCGFFDGHYNGSACLDRCGIGSIEMCDLDNPACPEGTTCNGSTHLPAPHGFCQ